MHRSGPVRPKGLFSFCQRNAISKAPNHRFADNILLTKQNSLQVCLPVRSVLLPFILWRWTNALLTLLLLFIILNPCPTQMSTLLTIFCAFPFLFRQINQSPSLPASFSFLIIGLFQGFSFYIALILQNIYSALLCTNFSSKEPSFSSERSWKHVLFSKTPHPLNPCLAQMSILPIFYLIFLFFRDFTHFA